jgi:hypothetical protein
LAKWSENFQKQNGAKIFKSKMERNFSKACETFHFKNSKKKYKFEKKCSINIAAERACELVNGLDF